MAERGSLNKIGGMTSPANAAGTAARVWRAISGWLNWTPSSYYLMGALVLIVGLIVVVWWPLAADYLAQADWKGAWWKQIDWLLIGIFAVMSLLIMSGADLKADLLIVLVGAGGGLVIESWGTQTLLWSYYTAERPPLWIIPAWPVASLAIDRIVRMLNRAVPGWVDQRHFRPLYWLMLGGFYALMLIFVWPTLGKSLTIAALLLSALLIASPLNYRTAALTFAGGSALGYFLELWGTTRLCWTYYTLEQPPLFAVLAHGMAALAFWRVGLIIARVYTAQVAPHVGRFAQRLASRAE